MRVAMRTSVALLLGASCAAFAQTPGEWKYTIATDLSSIPPEMRVNFPTVSFVACRSADDFSSGRAFALQTLASSVERCPSADFSRSAASDGKGDRVRFSFACDQGATLSGTGTGRVHAKRFEMQLDSRYTPTVSGVSDVTQTMNAIYLKPCAAAPDSDLLKVK
jgi:hypothetical protein